MRVDRSDGSALGNPFKMGQGASRHGVCRAATELFGAAMRPTARESAAGVARDFKLPAECVVCEPTDAQARRREAIEAIGRRLAAGEDVRLMCWCFPRECHATTVAALAIEHADALRARAARKRVR